MTQAVGDMKLKDRENLGAWVLLSLCTVSGVEALIVNYLMCNQQSRFRFMRLEAYAIWSVLLKGKKTKLQRQTC